MKRCEIIGNITTVLTLGLLGTTIIGWPVLEASELIAIMLTAIGTGAVSFIMDKIANDKSE
jgi:predicted membrane-bound spermidine synthase